MEKELLKKKLTSEFFKDYESGNCILRKSREIYFHLSIYIYKKIYWDTMFFSSVLSIPIKEYLPDSYKVHNMYLTMCRGSISVKYNNLYNTSPP